MHAAKVKNEYLPSEASELKEARGESRQCISDGVGCSAYHPVIWINK